MKLKMIEQEVNQLSQQSEAVEQNITELSEIKNSLLEIKKEKTKEFLANLGKKIFIPVEIKDKGLFVEVGNKNFVKKTVEETLDIISLQIGKLEDAKEEIKSRLKDLEGEMEEVISELNHGSSEK